MFYDGVYLKGLHG